MKKRIALLSIAAMTSLLAFAPAGPVDAQSVAGLTVLRVGGDPDYRPISFTDASGKMVGYDVDFATALAAHLGVPVHYEGMAWDGIVPALQGKKIDAITSIVITDKRKQVVAFSQPVLTQTITTVVRANRPDLNPTANDLKGLKVGVQVNTAAANVLSQIPGVTPVTYNTVPDAYNDLLLGRIDVVAIESINGFYTVASLYKGKLRVTGINLSKEAQPIAVALRKEDSALLTAVDAAIAKMRSDGTLGTVTKKWFGDTKMIAEPGTP
jgi:ABC-type amino acid transport substrate-binding protein